MAWHRVTFAAGGGKHRQFDVEVGATATIEYLRWDNTPDERWVIARIRKYVTRRAQSEIFEAGDRDSGLEIGHVWPVRDADADETVREIPGDNVPTEPAR